MQAWSDGDSQIHKKWQHLKDPGVWYYIDCLLNGENHPYICYNSSWTEILAFFNHASWVDQADMWCQEWQEYTVRMPRIESTTVWRDLVCLSFSSICNVRSPCMRIYWNCCSKSTLGALFHKINILGIIYGQFHGIDASWCRLRPETSCLTLPDWSHFRRTTALHSRKYPISTTKGILWLVWMAGCFELYMDGNVVFSVSLYHDRDHIKNLYHDYQQLNHNDHPFLLLFVGLLRCQDRATETFEVNNWCQLNCAVGICPQDYCVCD